VFQARDVFVADRGRLGNPVGDAVRRIGEARAYREQVALNPLEHLPHISVFDRCAHESEPRVQLVDVAVSRNAQIVLRHARAVEQTGVSTVAGPGVDFHLH